MALLNGDELRKIFWHFVPFDDRGRLLPEEKRVSILAANANFPLDLQGRAFTSVAAEGRGSPLIVQLSYTVLKTLGGPPEGAPPRSPESLPAVRGAVEGCSRIERYADIYGARLVALSIDHFHVPTFPVVSPDEGKPDLPHSPDSEVTGVPTGYPRNRGVATRSRDGLGEAIAEARIKDAMSYLEGAFGETAGIWETELAEYLRYLCSPQYRRFKSEFLNVVAAARPAWAMIDTEHLPPALNFVVTRDIVDTVRHELGDSRVMLEAEFGATGQSGNSEYELLKGKALKDFAEMVAAFVHYTGADGISYPIGMAHAAKKGERHEPDVERLEVVQRTILERTGRYVPFAQHGGTGAAALARGLVAKNNVNTFFLVVQANNLADHVLHNMDGIRAGEKAASGIEMYNKAVQAVAEAARAKLVECRSYQRGEELEKSAGIMR